MQPMQRISIDFEGHLPTINKNKYILTIVYEHSRFPFAIPCANTNATAVIESLNQVLVLTGLPNYVHSDRGSAFVSHKLRSYLHSLGVAASISSPYLPSGNAQAERYNGIIWKAVLLSLQSRQLPISHCETVLPTALPSVRSLLCTTMNPAPHNRFFAFNPRSYHGTDLPTWPMTSTNVLSRRFKRTHRPFVDEVELIDVSPIYAHIRHEEGRESTVSLKDIAPCPQVEIGGDCSEAADADVTPPQNPDEVEYRAWTSAELPSPNHHARTDDGVRRSNCSNKGIPPLRHGITIKYNVPCRDFRRFISHITVVLLPLRLISRATCVCHAPRHFGVEIIGRGECTNGLRLCHSRSGDVVCVALGTSCSSDNRIPVPIEFQRRSVGMHRDVTRGVGEHNPRDVESL